MESLRIPTTAEPASCNAREFVEKMCGEEVHRAWVEILAPCCETPRGSVLVLRIADNCLNVCLCENTDMALAGARLFDLRNSEKKRANVACAASALGATVWSVGKTPKLASTSGKSLTS